MDGRSSASSHSRPSLDAKWEQIENKDRVKSGSRFQRMSNKAISICVITYISYIIIVLDSVEMDCANGTEKFCLRQYLDLGGEPDVAFLLEPCHMQRAACRDGGMASDVSHLNLVDGDPGDQLFLQKFNTSLFMCYCLLHINDDLTGFKSSTDPLTCDFLYSRAVFFVVGVAISALLEYCTLDEDTNVERKAGHRRKFFYGRLICVVLSITYFLFAALWYDDKVNKSIKCESLEYRDIALIAQTIGAISMACIFLFICLFEIPNFVFLHKVTRDLAPASAKSS